MGKAEFAESLLLMTTTPEVAVPIAGDLVQEADARGTLWFWSTLFRTAASFAWRTFADSPFRLTRAAVVGSVVQYVNAVILYLTLVVLQMDLAIITNTNLDKGFFPPEFPSHPQAIATSILSSLGAAYLFGRRLARKFPNRELPVYVMTWALSQAVWLLMIRSEASTIAIYGPKGDLIMDVLTTVGCAVFALEGIERRRRQGALPGRIKRSLQKIWNSLPRELQQRLATVLREPVRNVGKGLRILIRTNSGSCGNGSFK
jgi:hypothetical protein